MTINEVSFASEVAFATNDNDNDTRSMNNADDYEAAWDWGCPQNNKRNIDLSTTNRQRSIFDSDLINCLKQMRRVY